MSSALLGFGVLAGVLGSAAAFTATGSLFLAFAAYAGTGFCVLLAALLAVMIFPEPDEELAEDPLLLIGDWQA